MDEGLRNLEEIDANEVPQDLAVTRCPIRNIKYLRHMTQLRTLDIYILTVTRRRA